MDTFSQANQESTEQPQDTFISNVTHKREVGSQDGQMKGKAASRKPGFYRLSLNFL